jgi:hypothetical protein
MTRFRPRDPHWITLRYQGECTGCGKPIPIGKRAFYYPIGKSLYGEACGCGEHQQAVFDGEVQDELFNKSML